MSNVCDARIFFKIDYLVVSLKSFSFGAKIYIFTFVETAWRAKLIDCHFK